MTELPAGVHHRGGVIGFIGECIAELRKVEWPGQKQVVTGSVVVIVACVIPVVDAISVWRGPTRHIVEERPEVFGALSFAFPVPGEGAFQLGLPDLLFFAIFLGAAARWGLRVLATWACLVASFGATMALAIYVDPFGIGGLPALPLLCVAFLAPNADLIWRRLRTERRDREHDVEPTK